MKVPTYDPKQTLPIYPPVTPPESWLDELGQAWLTYWHGRGAPHQYQYYRCKGGHHLVTHKAIALGGCQRCGSTKVSPAWLHWQDKVRLLCLPWTVK